MACGGFTFSPERADLDVERITAVTLAGDRTLVGAGRAVGAVDWRESPPRVYHRFLR